MMRPSVSSGPPVHPALQTGVTSTRRNSFHQHIADWESCTRCPLGELATFHVLTRGTLPCHVLFVGEAPGPAEDTLGKPFVGAAGNVLDNLLASTYHLKLTHCITNILACFPWDETKLPKKAFRIPAQPEVDACHPRLIELLKLASPRFLVLLGKVAAAQFQLPFPPEKTLHLYHPSYIQRNGGVGSLAYQEWKDTYLRFFKGHLNAKNEKA